MVIQAENAARHTCCPGHSIACLSRPRNGCKDFSLYCFTYSLLRVRESVRHDTKGHGREDYGKSLC
jgi:hypothetical protein